MNPSRSKNPIPSSDPYSNLRELASLRIVSGRVKIAATELMLVHCRTHLPLASDNSVPLIVTVNNGYPLPPPSRFSISVQVFILKEVKVVCFDTLLEVLILKVDTQKGGERSRGRK